MEGENLKTSYLRNKYFLNPFNRPLSHACYRKIAERLKRTINYQFFFIIRDFKQLWKLHALAKTQIIKTRTAREVEDFFGMLFTPFTTA